MSVSEHGQASEKSLEEQVQTILLDYGVSYRPKLSEASQKILATVGAERAKEIAKIEALPFRKTPVLRNARDIVGYVYDIDKEAVLNILKGLEPPSPMMLPIWSEPISKDDKLLIVECPNCHQKGLVHESHMKFHTDSSLCQFCLLQSNEKVMVRLQLSPPQSQKDGTGVEP